MAKASRELIRKPVPGWDGYEVEASGILWQKQPGGFRRVLSSGGFYHLKSTSQKGSERSVGVLRAPGKALAAMAFGPAQAPVEETPVLVEEPAQAPAEEPTVKPARKKG